MNIEKGRTWNHRDGMSELKIFEEQLKEKEMTDENFKEKAEFEAEATKDVVGPMAVSPKILSEVKKLTAEMEKTTAVPESLVKGLEEAKEGKLLDSPEDFSKFVTKKKRGRPKKVKEEDKVKVKEAVEEVKEFKCKSCQELINDKNVMRIGAGENRWAVFCPFCQRSLGFQDKAFQDKIDHLIKDNPVKD